MLSKLELRCLRGGLPVGCLRLAYRSRLFYALQFLASWWTCGAASGRNNYLTSGVLFNLTVLCQSTQEGEGQMKRQGQRLQTNSSSRWCVEVSGVFCLYGESTIDLKAIWNVSSGGKWNRPITEHRWASANLMNKPYSEYVLLNINTLANSIMFVWAVKHFYPLLLKLVICCDIRSSIC